ncbi:hypothetical protein [Enterococcus sp. AZ152]|uniref:hypothetical protein n=1 Tax=Enterococcus sp. AZ152 TaxID=2774848 RepID=UPI003F23B6FE
MSKVFLMISLVIVVGFILIAVYACCVVAGRADQQMNWDSKSQFNIKDKAPENKKVTDRRNEYEVSTTN